AWSTSCEGRDQARLSNVGVRYCDEYEPGCAWSDVERSMCEAETSVQAFVMQGQARRFGPALSCNEGLTAHTAFDDLAPGRFTAGFRLVKPRLGEANVPDAGSRARTLSDSGAPHVDGPDSGTLDAAVRSAGSRDAAVRDAG